MSASPSSSDSRETLNSDDFLCSESLSDVSDDDCPESSRSNVTVPKEDARWSLATYHARREIGSRDPREKRWIETTVACGPAATRYKRELWRTYRRRSRGDSPPSRTRRRERFRIIDDRIEFRIPVDSAGEAMWISVKNHIYCDSCSQVHREYGVWKK